MELYNAFIGSIFVIIFVVITTWIVEFGVDRFEKWSPTSRWFVYASIEPITTGFDYGETLKFKSTVTRHIASEVRQEDTLYCFDGQSNEKYPTQYRPVEGTERKIKGVSKNIVWSYKYQIDIDEKECIMCGTPTAYTPNGHEKRYEYCTDIFKVNL